jgi:hypothetical protein
MPSIPFDYNAYNYEVFAQSLLEWLELNGDVHILPYAMQVNPKGNLDTYIVLWLVAHAPPEAVKFAEERSKRG